MIISLIMALVVLQVCATQSFAAPQPPLVSMQLSTEEENKERDFDDRQSAGNSNRTSRPEIIYNPTWAYGTGLEF